MKNTQIITIFVSVALILFVHYTLTHSCEYFGVGSGRGGGAEPSQGPGARAAPATINYHTVTPIKFQVANELYGDEVMSKNRALMNEIMTKVDAVITAISSF